MVAVVEMIIEFLGNNFLPFKAFGVTCWIESFKILFNNTLNHSVKNKPKRIIPLSKLPTRMIYFDFKPKSLNTLELILNEGWSFSLRIHNASSRVEPSLKFDIKLLSIPVSVAVFIVGF